MITNYNRGGTGMLEHTKHKYWGFLGLLSLIGLKGLTTDQHLWCLFFINYLWFTLFYENSYIYKIQRNKM